MGYPLRLRSRCTAQCGLALLLLAGCAPGGLHVVPVSGTVTFDGKPLTSGTVIYLPDSEQGNTMPHEPRGRIEADGTYQLFTLRQAGAPPGAYRVAVVAVKPGTEDSFEPPQYLVPPQYASPETSGLVKQVLENAPPGAYDINIDP